jgi:antitoxin ParD1/3/4
MAKNTSVLLGDYFENFVSKQVESGRYSSASDVIRTALRSLEKEEKLKDSLIKELKKGEKSGIYKNFQRDKFLNKLHQKYINK